MDKAKEDRRHVKKETFNIKNLLSDASNANKQSGHLPAYSINQSLHSKREHLRASEGRVPHRREESQDSKIKMTEGGTQSYPPHNIFVGTHGSNDNLKEQYVSVWMDSMSTAIMYQTSTLDAGTFVTVGPNGHGGTMKTVSTMDEDSGTDIFFEKLEDGSWHKSGTITYKRQ